MKRYLNYIAEIDTNHKNAVMDYYFVDYFNETAHSITLRLSRSQKQSSEFDYLVEDLFSFSQLSEKIEIKTFVRDGKYTVVTIIYTF